MPHRVRASPRTGTMRGQARQAGLRELRHVDGRALQARSRLSPRELEVVRRIMMGAKQAAVAAAMGLALGTVKTYCRRAHAKLGVRSQAELPLAILVTHAVPRRRSRATAKRA